jgi:hypothetical protein
MPRRRVTFSGARATPNRERPIEPAEPHVCEVCGAAAMWGYGVRLLHGQPGRWYCTDHRPLE